jgi:hypothetical protein
MRLSKWWPAANAIIPALLSVLLAALIALAID